MFVCLLFEELSDRGHEVERETWYNIDLGCFVCLLFEELSDRGHEVERETWYNIDLDCFVCLFVCCLKS